MLQRAGGAGDAKINNREIQIGRQITLEAYDDDLAERMNPVNARVNKQKKAMAGKIQAGSKVLFLIMAITGCVLLIEILRGVEFSLEVRR